MKIHRAQRFLIIFALIIYGVLDYYYTVNRPVELPLAWDRQFHGLIIASALLTVGSYLIPVWWVPLVGFFMRSLFALIILEAMPGLLNVFSLLVFLLIIEIFMVSSVKSGVFGSLFFIYLLIQQRYKNNAVWGIVYPAPRLSDVLIPCLLCFNALMLGLLIRTLLNRYQQLMRLVNHYQESNTRLVEANIRLQEYAVRSQTESIVSERNRISREIHDSVGYIITNLIAILDYTRELITAGRVEALENFDKSRDLAREALADVRRAVRALRPPVKMYLSQSIPKLAHAFSQATGINVSLEIPEWPLDLEEENEWLIYRVIQEALTNTFRHGRANTVYIKLRVAEGKVYLTIKDDGLGSANIIPGCGLTGIKERIHAKNGELSIDSSPGFGFTLHFWIPFEGSGVNEANQNLIGG
ncbi:MAG TPA: sensor histidine kinase [Firmicutes bacterium]|nr:sensor histidine kinase [Bacillota bacterium]